jgi:hypothetical protein
MKSCKTDQRYKTNHSFWCGNVGGDPWHTLVLFVSDTYPWYPLGEEVTTESTLLPPTVAQWHLPNICERPVPAL